MNICLNSERQNKTFGGEKIDKKQKSHFYDNLVPARS